MVNKSCKQREREVGELVGGKRYPANQGGRVDVEGPNFVVQVKERKSLSLAELNALVEEIEAIGKAKGKYGLVAVKLRKGRGNPTDMLIVQSAPQWRRLTNETFDLGLDTVTTPNGV
jgi:hypothetical protein